MPLSLRPLAALLLAVAITPAALSQSSALAGTEVRATVLSIGDGDTIRVQQGQQRITVRLACIDAPEMAQAPHGAQARRYLQSRLRLGSSVTLRPQTVDRYGRTVAEVISGVNINLALVEDGLAFVDRSTWASATPGRTWRRSSGVSAAAMACAGCRGASPDPGTFGGATGRRVRQAVESQYT
ncbi:MULTISPECIES: thermonuclease family protein [unclassified Synechococcus]|uniref:thermonuclease family protein n=1 Tax=unclassified Synechococcus TaxID=2626047 RepID=UPI0021A5FEE7|nr:MULTISPECIES: thermonuclease family protein [unclassified Synechococcus]